MLAPLASPQKDSKIIKATCRCHHVGESPQRSIIAATNTASIAGLCRLVLTIAFRAPRAKSFTAGLSSNGCCFAKALSRLMARFAATTRVCAFGSSRTTFARNAVTMVSDVSLF